MNHAAAIARPFRALRAAALGAAAIGSLVLGGCYNTYSADVRNTTPQPVYMQIVKTGGAPNLLRSARLGPGDRGSIGPVTVDQRDLVRLVIDTGPNPNRPLTLDLRPGLNVYEVQQEGTMTAGPLRVREINN
jgi:hypothetical protein